MADPRELALAAFRGGDSDPREVAAVCGKRGAPFASEHQALWGSLDVITAVCISVYDGDTCTVLMQHPSLGEPVKQKVRFFGIDTPEVRSKKEDPEEHAKEERDARAAKKFVADEILGHRILMRIHRSDTDKYGRKLGIIYMPGKAVDSRADNLYLNSLNDALVAAGHAVERWRELGFD